MGLTVCIRVCCSGFMIAHCTAASLVSENKVLVHPASCDSITTSAGQEDHVSMGGFAARKAISVVRNVETILAIELLCACQALDLLHPLQGTGPVRKILAYVREHVAFWKEDRYMKPDITAALRLVQSGSLLEALKQEPSP